MRSITIKPGVPATVPDGSLQPVILTNSPGYWTQETKDALAAQVTPENEGIDWDFIPDPLPPQPEPGWTAFNTAMLLDSDWSPWIAQNPLLTSATTMASLNQNLELLQTTIETAIAVLGQPDPVAAQRWQYIADANFIPIQFGEP